MLQPTISSPYLRLMRLHQPVGIWLLLWPCLWSITIASAGEPSVELLVLFSLGAIIMRSAGCIINDIWDRDFDRHVERTRSRPLASGELSLQQALLLLLVLLFLALFIMLQLPVAVWYLAVASLLPVAIYPAMKRVTWWPQFFLGLAFNWGALMGWAAVTGKIEPAAIALYIGGVFWTLGYDTIYAHQDKTDDTKIGVKSTALLLGANSRRAILVFYITAILCILTCGFLSEQMVGFYVGVLLFGMQLLYQAVNVDFDHPESCLQMFKSNSWAGVFPIILLYLSTF